MAKTKQLPAGPPQPLWVPGLQTQTMLGPSARNEPQSAWPIDQSHHRPALGPKAFTPKFPLAGNRECIWKRLSVNKTLGLHPDLPVPTEYTSWVLKPEQWKKLSFFVCLIFFKGTWVFFQISHTAP